MKLTVFRKKAKSKQTGVEFNVYLGKLKNKNGNEDSVSIKFREECGVPTTFPTIIEVERTDVNLVKKTITKEDGTTVESRTLWITKWSESDEKYRDTSLDDYE